MRVLFELERKVLWLELDENDNDFDVDYISQKS